MTNAGESDEALMVRYARGDSAAFELLYRRHEMRIWRYLERNVRNRATADDLMQEVWFAVARDAARYEPTARFTTWLFTIAHNRMIDSIRTSRPQLSLETVGYESESVVRKFFRRVARGSRDRHPVSIYQSRDRQCRQCGVEVGDLHCCATSGNARVLAQDGDLHRPAGGFD